MVWFIATEFRVFQREITANNIILEINSNKFNLVLKEQEKRFHSSLATGFQ